MKYSPNTRMFNLTRYFSALSLVLIALAGGVLGSYFHKASTHHLISQAEHDNVAMTHFVRNALSKEFAAIVALSHSPQDAPGQGVDAKAAELHPSVLALIRNSDVIKVKAYNRNGLTVYSTDQVQLGESVGHKPGFQAAIGGRVSSDLKHRDVFNAHDGERAKIDFIASYVPMYDQDGNIYGVFEIYREVTTLVQRVDRVLWQVVIAAVASLTLLYLLQLLMVRHAQRILRLQATELQTSNLELDRRVQERTAALEGEIAERRRAESRLDHLAHHDPLTGLPNRLMFKEHLSQCLSRATRQKSRLAVLFIDLDRFKDVNDTLGHSVGDELLVAVTRRVKTCVRSSDILARQGGDEFLCILEDIANQDAVAQVADKLLALFRQPFTVGGNELCLSGSIGVCIAPDDGNEVDILVRNADAAMYQAKAQGRNRYHFYTVELTRLAQERMQLETLLRYAIEANELSVHFQPKVDAGDSSLTGAEALLRWNSRELGNIPPSRFITLAEENGQIIELGAWVLREACQQLALWDQDGFFVPQMSINLSVKQLEHSDFLAQAGDILRASGINPARIEFEITESVIMSVDDSLAVLNRLCALGVTLSVDDFGTGYSSLTYLKVLPLHTIKVDRSFVNGIGVNPGDEAIVRVIVELSHSLGFITVAEGVETSLQAQFLRSVGCDQIQGFFFGKAVTAAEFQAHWQGPGNSRMFPASLSAPVIDSL